MDVFYLTFPVSGVKTWVFLPPLVAFVVSFCTSMGGVSGAFMLLPYQLSVLHYTAPSVSGTNQLFNVIAIPSGVWRYIKEGRMVWPLTWAVIIGTLPGVVVGVWIRIQYLPDPTRFKFFAGLVLLYIGIRLLADIVRNRRRTKQKETAQAGGEPADFVVSDTRFSLSRVEFVFGREHYGFSVPGVFFLCLVVGGIGGVYGIGGGAIIAPFFVTFFHLPIYAVAGAALMGTFVTSVAGVVLFQSLALLYPEMSIAPDWLLGILFGVGGLLGMYCGARCQRFVPAGLIKLILCFCVFFVACTYIAAFLR